MKAWAKRWREGSEWWKRFKRRTGCLQQRSTYSFNRILHGLKLTKVWRWSTWELIKWLDRRYLRSWSHLSIKACRRSLRLYRPRLTSLTWCISFRRTSIIMRVWCTSQISSGYKASFQTLFTSWRGVSLHLSKRGAMNFSLCRLRSKLKMESLYHRLDWTWTMNIWTRYSQNV